MRVELWLKAEPFDQLVGVQEMSRALLRAPAAGTTTWRGVRRIFVRLGLPSRHYEARTPIFRIG